jgi:L-malate glycosyltransferase
MRVAFVLSTCAKSGPFIVANSIANNLFNKVQKMDIFYIKDSKEKLEFKAETLKINFFKKTNLSGYDVVHSHGFLGDCFVFFNRKSLSGKWITTLHQKIEPVYSMQYNKIIGFFLEKVWCFIIGKSNSIVTLTNEMSEYYSEKFKSNKISFIYNGTSPIVNDLSTSEREMILSFKQNFKLIGISANLIHLKGIDRVIKALPYPNAKNLALIVIGEGHKREELIELAKQIGVESRCKFLGFKKNAIDYFKYFDVYMMSSRSEGFGLCVIEAASQKIPIVCNDLSVFRELFDDEVIRFNLADLGSMLEAIHKALINKDYLSEKASMKYNSNYTSEIMASNYLKLYHADG